MTAWKRNLRITLVAQFLSIAGFFLAIPFVPYYFQEMGITDPRRLKLAVSFFAAATPLTMAVASPFWGTLADRYGRKPMLVRATVSAALAMTLMGCVETLQAILALRVLQGLVSGIVPAAQALISAGTPEEKNGFALGALNSVLFSGMLFGPFLGGILAEHLGYRALFFLSGALMLSGGLLVLCGVREPGERNTACRQGSESHRGFSGTTPGACWPLLLLIATISFTTRLDGAFFPLFLQQIHGSLEGAAFWTGCASALAGGAGLASGLVLGRLADRHHPATVSACFALLGGFLMVLHALAGSVPVLLGARSALSFCAAGIDPVFLVWLGRITAREKRGAVFGWAGTAKSLAWTAAPLAGGALAALHGLRALYFFGAVLLLGLFFQIGLSRRKLERSPDKEKIHHGKVRPPNG